MKLALNVALGVALVAGCLLLAGLLLPKTREGTATRLIAAPPDLVRRTILDVTAQPEWRSGIAAIEPRPDGGWTEIKADGERIAFRLTEDSASGIALGFDSTRGYTGRWQGRIEAAGDGTTRLTVTEVATIPSPVGRLLARIFFDPAAFATMYLDELAAEVRRRQAAEG